MHQSSGFHFWATESSSFRSLPSLCKFWWGNHYARPEGWWHQQNQGDHSNCCVTHKLEFAVLDANKSCSQMKKFEDTLKGIFNYYHFSPKQRRELKEISVYLIQSLHISVDSIKWDGWQAKNVQFLLLRWTLQQWWYTLSIGTVKEQGLKAPVMQKATTKKSPQSPISRFCISCLISCQLFQGFQRISRKKKSYLWNPGKNMKDAQERQEIWRCELDWHSGILCQLCWLSNHP